MIFREWSYHHNVLMWKMFEKVSHIIIVICGLHFGLMWWMMAWGFSQLNNWKAKKAHTVELKDLSHQQDYVFV